MNFLEATSKLTRRVTLGDLARELNVTTVELSRARADASHRDHRQPPESWQAAVAKLARQQARHLARVAAGLSAANEARRATAAGAAKRRGRKRAAAK